jgi:nucleoside-diphosphate-sugar epimerase
MPSRPSWTNTGPMSSFIAQPSEDRMLSKRCVDTVSPSAICSQRFRPDPDPDEPFSYVQNPEAVQKLNVGVPALLSTLSRSSEHPFFLLYISTDYVFDGHAPADGYEPEAATNPTNAYGVSKLEGEHVVLAGLKAGGKGCVLRLPVLWVTCLSAR